MKKKKRRAHRYFANAIDQSDERNSSKCSMK